MQTAYHKYLCKKTTGLLGKRSLNYNCLFTAVFPAAFTAQYLPLICWTSSKTLPHYPPLPVHVFPVLIDSGLLQIRMVSHSGNTHNTPNSATCSYLLTPAAQGDAPRLASFQESLVQRSKTRASGSSLEGINTTSEAHTAPEYRSGSTSLGSYSNTTSGLTC